MFIEDFEDLYQNAPSGYLSLDPKGLILTANTTLGGWLGVSRDQLLGKRFNQLLSVPGQVFYETHIAPMLRMQGFFDEVVIDLLKSDGSKLSVLVSAKEQHESDGTLAFTRISVFRATERHRYERELVAMRNAADKARRDLEAVNDGMAARINEAVAARLHAEQGLTTSVAEAKALKISLMAKEELSDLRDQFIAVLGHDLRNPLAALTGGLGFLEGQILEKRCRNVLELMRGSVTRMSRLIDDVLDFARGRLGNGLPAVQENIDLGEVLRQLIDEFRLAYPARDFETSIDLPLPIKCDKARLAQLVSNLLGNAIAHGAPETAIQLHAYVKSRILEIFVSNSGKQIPDSDLARLFLPFFRGEAKTNQHGLGLGLYIVSEIARAHKGHIDVSSSPTETRFTFRMAVN